MSDQPFSSAGFVLKTEKVKNIESNIVPDSMVAEALEPFPGYHGENVPDNLEPEYIFLFLRHPYSQEDIVRATSRIKKYCDNPFEAHYCILRVYNNEYYYTIRLRNLTDYEHISRIQECYMDEGLELHKSKKIDTTGILKVFKVFNLEPLGDGIFKDVHETCLHYLEMPGYMNWKLFVDLTRKVKQNVEAINFDAALASIFDYQDIREFVRIYCFREQANQLKDIRDRYLQYYEYMKKVL